MSMDRLFCESVEEAIDEVCKANGGRKKTAVELWPSSGVREAHNRMDACLNPERREKFDPQEIVWFITLGRRISCHSLMRYLSQQGSYVEPQPIEPEDEKARLQREYIDAVNRLAKLQTDINRVTSLRAA